MLPGPEALQLAIYVGYLKKKLVGGILAGLTFILPGALIMIALSWMYVAYSGLPQVNNALYILKPAVLGIITAGILKLGRATIKNAFLAVLLVIAFVGLKFVGVNFLLLLLLAGLLNLFVAEGLWKARATLPALGLFFSLLPLSNSRWFQMSWLFLKTGLFSFGGAYASVAFLEHGAVEQHQWLTTSQLLDGVALSVATPGPFMLFSTFVGFLAGGVRGAIIATFFVFLPSFVFVLTGARYDDKVRSNRFLQAFLTGASAAVVGVIVVVSLELLPAALVDGPTIVIALIAFLVITVIKVDVAKVALGAMTAGVAYAVVANAL
jgi:chromate transporter